MPNTNPWNAPPNETPWLAVDAPPWWHRVLWSLACGCAAIAIGYLLLLLSMEVARQFPRAPGNFQSLAEFESSLSDSIGYALVMTYFLVYETLVAGVVGLFAGALFPGRIGFGATVVAHACGCLALSGLMLNEGPEFRIHSPFYFAAAVLLGLIAFALLRLTDATPSEPTVEKKPPPEESW